MNKHQDTPNPKNIPKDDQNLQKNDKIFKTQPSDSTKKGKDKPALEPLSTTNCKSVSNETKSMVDTAFLESLNEKSEDNGATNELGTISFN